MMGFALALSALRRRKRGLCIEFVIADWSVILHRRLGTAKEVGPPESKARAF
jgi:hypothetical protein